MPAHQEFTQIEYSVSDHIATITLNRPEKLNAFTNTMLHEIIDAFDLTDANDDVRAVIMTGAGRAFCAGADLSGVAQHSVEVEATFKVFVAFRVTAEDSYLCESSTARSP